ncbi:putative RNA binding protein [Leishmania braziliensis MHOM/BR/75/M2904]|uniref:RNA binding protein n=1 Tax=Leishmania braziliensis TaxID=5660 RepID=A4HHF3_LEIBR|nr:putative RNA binding protein [Leishmania braziliensis MHOM/BR/75/M2904]CAJ2476548.1 unnamed protein product [Leishmania braziliensis]CAM40006.1 putative RNA binding protein [Leishmania braziliensis MHOM/BR/75/M2904]
MARLHSSCISVPTHSTTHHRAASPAALLPSASILSPPAREENATGVADSHADEGCSNDTTTPQMVNAVSPFVRSDKMKKIASDTSSSTGSNHSHPRTTVQRNRAPTMNTRPRPGAVAPRKGRSTRATTAAAAQITASEENNLHNSNLFICNLDTKVSQVELETAFAEHGTILSSAVMRDIHTGESLGTAFVRMSSHDEARRTMKAMNGVHVGSRSISVQWARRSEGAPVGEARKKIMKLFVRNIPLDCTKVDLEELFGVYGGVRQVTLHKDTSPVQDETMMRLIAFVIYTEEGAAERAAREVHNTKPFASCHGIPIMVKLAEDLVKHYREHNHQHQQQQSELNHTVSSAKRRLRGSSRPRNTRARTTSESPGPKQIIRSGNTCISPSSRVFQSCGTDASMTDMCMTEEVSLFRNYAKLTPPQCNVPPVKAPLPPQHTISCVRAMPAPAAASVLPLNLLQFPATTPFLIGGSMPVVGTLECEGATAAPIVEDSQWPSFIDFSGRQAQGSFFSSGSALQVSQLAPPKEQQFRQLQVPQFSQIPITAPVVPRFYHLLVDHTMPELPYAGAAAAIPTRHPTTLPTLGHFMKISKATVSSGPGEVCALQVVEATSTTPPASLHSGQSVAMASPKSPQTYRHNPYINCSFIRVG